MGGLWSVFKKVIPIITLVCFICLGITHTFQQVGANNITYLSTETYDKETWEKIENPTPQEQENGFTYYTFDTNSYMSNFNVNYLKDSATNVSNLEAFVNTINKFNEIWEDGYQFLDGVKTIINGLLLIFNGLLTAVNLVLWPIRVISALFLTAFNLVGINTTYQIANGGIICNTLYFFCYQLAIPLINPTNNVDTNTTLNGQEYRFINTNLELNTSIWANRKYFYFESNGIKWSTLNDYSNKIVYGRYEQNNANQITLTVYENGQWIDQNYRNITILNKNTLDDNEVAEIQTFLNKNCIDTRLQGTSWTWNNNPSFTSEDADFKPNINFTSNNTNYDILRYGQVQSDNLVIYSNSSNNNITIVYQNQTWANDNYKTFTISNINENITKPIADKLLATFNTNATQIS